MTNPKTSITSQFSEMLSFAVHTTALGFVQLYRHALENIGLTYPQYLVLVALWETDGLRVKDVGRALFLDSGTLTPLLKRLEKSGLISRTRNECDQREVLIHLTSSGRALRSRGIVIERYIADDLALDQQRLNEARAVIDQLRGSIYAALSQQ